MRQPAITAPLSRFLAVADVDRSTASSATSLALR